MDDTALMIRLLGRLRKEMNGAVVETMRQCGVNYPLNYGVSLITIRDIAKEYAPNHSLAQFLYKQQVRELKFAAAWIDDPQQVDAEQMRRWADDFVYTEQVEQAVYALFRYVSPSVAEPVALEWLKSFSTIKSYAGLLTAAAVISPESKKESLDALFDAADQITRDFVDLDCNVVRGIETLFMKLAEISPSYRGRVQVAAAIYENTSDLAIRSLASELKWRLEYLGR